MVKVLAVINLLFLGTAAATAGENSPLLHKAVFGLVIHDRGPASDRHEDGVDPNLEIQLIPPTWELWRSIGSPYPMVGITPNLNGDTSVLYGGINYDLGLWNKPGANLTRDLFVAASVSLALHNGPLHKDKVGCRERSDCGFGYRVLPRLAIELGAGATKNRGMSLFYDHMSHKYVLPGENEGIDHIGIRYHVKFNRS